MAGWFFCYSSSCSRVLSSSRVSGNFILRAPGEKVQKSLRQHHCRVERLWDCDITGRQVSSPVYQSSFRRGNELCGCLGEPLCGVVEEAGLFVEVLLELSPLKLDGVFLQLGLQALDGVVHHVRLHLSQDLKDPPVTGREQPQRGN